MGRLEVTQMWNGINYLCPFYDADGGNYTKVFSTNGEHLIDKRKTKTVLGALAKHFAVDLKSSRDNYGKKINRRKSVPIPFHPEIVMIPLRVREPQRKDEGAVAYVNSSKVNGLEILKDDLPFKTALIFKDQTRIKTLQSSTSVKALLKDADLVRSSYLNLYQIPRMVDGQLREGLESLLFLINSQNTKGLHL